MKDAFRERSSAFGLSEDFVSESEGVDDDRSNRNTESESGTVATTTRHEIGRDESRMVHGSKILVIIVLVLATVISAGGAYIFTVRAEEATFKVQVSLVL